MDKQQKDVLTFHRTCDLPVSDEYIGFSRAAFRLRLIEEEFTELVEAIEENDFVKAADSLVDMMVVINGTGLEWGIDLEPLWDEVQRANMDKSTGPKRADGKQLKPPGWKPPDIHARLVEQGWDGNQSKEDC